MTKISLTNGTEKSTLYSGKATHDESRGPFLECILHGKRLEAIAAKADLPHGEWAAMVKSDLRFSPRTASTMMLIARRFTANGESANENKDLSNRRARADLPSGISILEALVSFSENELDVMIADGTVSKEMTQKQARDLRKQAVAKKREAERPEAVAAAVKEGAYQSKWARQVRDPDHKLAFLNPEFKKEKAKSFAGLTPQEKNKYPWVATATKPELDKQLARSADDALLNTLAWAENALQKLDLDVADKLKNHFLREPEMLAENARENFKVNFTRRFFVLERIYLNLKPYAEAIRARKKDTA